MTLRLILFVIAILVIIWIVWDHNRKQNKNANNKLNNKINKPKDINNFRQNYGLEYDIEHELGFNAKTEVESLENFQATTPVSSFSKTEFDDIDETDEIEDTKEIDELDDYNNIELSELPVEPNYIPKNFKEPRNESKQEVQKDAQSERVFSLYLRRRDNNYLDGEKLLQGLLSVGCRYGEMEIFHRHEKTSGQGKIMFSVASMINPGTFDIENMHEFKTPGILLFFTHPGVFAPTMVFDLMLKTAYNLVKFLDVEILDENRELLTAEKVAEIQDTLELIEAQEFFG